MTSNYGLSAMTGIIPVTMMAGVNVAVIKELFPERYGKKKRSSKKRKSKRSQKKMFTGLQGLGL